jgi:uncharacterized RDD family membrane protein YckC
MKCPKCDYLGFETGDRCKNCGYDFSLSTMTATTGVEPELVLRETEPFSGDADRWLNQLEARLDNVRPAAMSGPTEPDPLASIALHRPASVPAAPSVHRSNSPSAALPLFQRAGADLDEPLIKVPSAPRPPLAVRRTPEKPKLRTVPKPARRVGDRDADPVLAFAEEPLISPTTRAEGTGSKKPAAVPANDVSGLVRRLTAAVVDVLILLSIDAVVIYFTFKIAGLAFSSWQTLPILPLTLFLVLVKVSYFSVFTTLGGQTVGKMATGIRVVADNDREVAPAQAVQRTLAALASVATVGIGFAPVILGGQRRALHDRVAGTRVVGPVRE